MKTILVLSDTHGNKQAIDKIAIQLIEADYVFHLGDVHTDAEYIIKKYNKNVVSVLGNCDSFRVDSEEIVDIEGVKFMLCHGHKYGVKSGLMNLYYEALEKKVNVALYGHTHEALYEKMDGVTLINPGAMTFWGEKSYCYLTVVGEKVVGKIVEIR